MESSLRRLRKAAGYKTAKAFAERVGIPVTTYSNYEQPGDGGEPSIPLKAAWNIADVLGCTIDAVVGRGEAPASGMSGEVQARYDALSDDGKQLVEDFLDMAERREARAAEMRRVELARRYAKEERRYELKFLESVDDTPEEDGFMFFGSDADMRQAFEEFVAPEVAEADERRIEQLCELAMKHFTRPDRHAAALPGLPVPNPRARDREHLAQLKEEHALEIRRILEEKSEERIKGVMEGIMAAYDSAHPADGNVTYAVVDLK